MTRLALAATLAFVLTPALPALAQDVFIAGLEPSHRPTGAPVITEVVKDAEWYQEALSGVDQPYPASLRFLEDQGNWYNPFLHPGMAPYDIRNWHSQD